MERSGSEKGSGSAISQKTLEVEHPESVLYTHTHIIMHLYSKEICRMPN
jgi:hypothetical protein